MRISALLVAAYLVTPSTARADWAADTFSSFFEGPTRDLQGFRVDGPRLLYSHVILGQVRSGEHWFARALLLECTARRCRGTPVYLGTAADDYRWALIDLRGAPGTFPALARPRARPSLDTLPARGGRWPALVIETSRTRETTSASRYGGRVRGPHRQRELSIVSLRRRERSRPQVFTSRSLDRYPTGTGTSATYRLVRAGPRRELAIEEITQRHLDNRSMCLRPEPVTRRYRWRGARFELDTRLADRAGCGR